MTTPLSNARGEIHLDASGVRRGVDTAVDSLNRLKGNLTSIAGLMGGAFLAGTTALAGGLAAIATSGVKMAMDLQAQMSGIQAIMGASTEEVKQLEDAIVELGLDPNLKVSTEEAASAIEMLGRNGLTTQEILDGAARSTVLLSNATGGDFAQSADIATDVMALFNIEAADMITAVDGITSVVTNSKFSVNDYALALAQGGGVAATAGVEFSDFNTTIAAISPLFASGSDAGTSFKTALMRLAAPTDKARGEMNRLGLEFYDAQGNMKSMAEISAMLNQALYGTSEVMVEVGGRTAEQNAELQRLQGAYSDTEQKIRDYELGILGAGLSESARAEKIAELNASLGIMEGNMAPLLAITGDLTTATRQLSEEERTAALTTIFGSDAMRAMAGLAESGAVAYETAAEAAEALGVSIDQVSGFAEGGITHYEALMISMGQTSATDAAATRMDNLAGSLEILEGIVDAIKIKIGQAFLGVLKQAADSVGRFLDANGDRFVAFFETAAGVIETFMDSLESGGDVIGAITVAFQNLTPDPAMRAKILEISNAIRDLIEKVITFVQDHSEEFKGALIGIGVVLGGAAVLGAILAVGGALASLLNPITLIITAAGLIGAAWAGNWGGIRDKVTTAVDAIRERLQAIRDWFDANKGPIQEFADNTFGRVGRKLREVAGQVGGFVREQFEKISGWFRENRPLIEAFATRVGTVLGGLVAAFVFVASRVGEALLGAWTVVSPVLGGLIDLILGLATAIMQVVTGDWAGAWETLKQTAVNVWESLKEAFTNFLNWVTGWFGTSWEGVKETWRENWERFKEILALAWEAIKTTITEKFLAIKEAIALKWEEIQTAVSEKIQAIKDTVALKWEEIKAAVLEKLRALFASMGLDFDAMVLRWTAIWEDVKLIASTIWENIKAAVAEKAAQVLLSVVTKLEEIRAAWSEKWDSIRTKVTLAWTLIKAAVATKIQELKQGISDKTEDIKSDLTTRWYQIKNAILLAWIAIKAEVGTKIDELKALVGEKIESIRSRISEFIAPFKQVGRDLLSGLKDGALEMAGDLITAVTGSIEDAIAAAKALLGIESPSKVFKNFGVQSFMGYIVAAEQMAGRVKGAVVDALTPAITQAQRLATTPVPSVARPAALPSSLSSAGGGTGVERLLLQIVEALQGQDGGSVVNLFGGQSFPNVHDSRGLLAELQGLSNPSPGF